VQVKRNLVYLQGLRGPQMQAAEIAYQFSIEPHSDTAVPLTGCVGLDHQFEGVPPSQLRYDLRSRNKIRPEVARHAVEGSDTARGEEIVSPNVTLFWVIYACLDICMP